MYLYEYRFEIMDEIKMCIVLLFTDHSGIVIMVLTGIVTYDLCF